MNCKFCNKHLDKKRKSFCNKECRINSQKTEGGYMNELQRDRATGVKFTDERKKNISIARTIVIDDDSLEILKRIWELGYVVDRDLVIEKSGLNLSTRVYERILKQNFEFIESCNQLKFLPIKIQKMSEGEFKNMMSDLENIKTRDFCEKYQLNEKTVNRILKHYNLKWISKNKFTGNKPKTTELKFEKILIELKIEYVHQYKLGKYFYDFKIGDKLFEIHGDYWHSNPEIYGKPKSKTQIMNYENDINKKQFSDDNGFELVIVWEKSLRENFDEVYEMMRQKYAKNEN